MLCVPVGDGAVWFKACAQGQAFEAPLSAALFARWPDRVAEVLAHDEQRAWLLLADAGTPIGAYGNPPEAWLVALPLYAELQRGEVAQTPAHLAAGIPDLRIAALPARFEELAHREFDFLDDDERAGLCRFASRFAQLCAELEALGRPATIQHDDLHHANVYDHGGRLRVLDWGDSSIAHPFMSLVVTFRFLEEMNSLPPDDRWFARLRDAYLEPWGRGLVEEFELALKIGRFAHAVAWLRQRDRLSAEERRAFDRSFMVVVRRALALI